MDYAKRAAKLVQCESNNGYWLTRIDGRYLADGHGENAADVTEQIRAWLAAELQAAHDAGVAEGKRRCREATQAIIEGVGASGPMSLEEAVAKVIARLQDRNAEVAALRQIISDAAREVGAQVSPECSLEFMALLSREVAMALRRAEKTANDAGVAEERARWVQVATAARSALGKYAHDTGYGFFIGGDPRRFSPDEESSTSEEIAAWKAACAEAEADEKVRDLASPCGLEIVEHEGRNVPAFVDRAPFGLGTYECGDEAAAAACEAITALLGDGLIAGATESNEGGR